MKLDQKVMIKTRYKRLYGDPLTPYARVMASPAVEPGVKASLKLLHESLDPVQLKSSIERKLRKIFELRKALLAGVRHADSV
jgi:hypothetical protein